MLTKTLVAVSLLALEANAFWRLPCRGTLSVERVDPVDCIPPKPAAHVHTIHGSSNFNMYATNDDLRKSDCTTCAVPEDMSAYWAPYLYWQDFGTKEIIALNTTGGLLVYYLLRPENVKLEIFPENFRMIAGDSRKRTWDYPDPSVNDPRKAGTWSDEDSMDNKKKEAHAIGWNCLNYDQPAEDTLMRKKIPQGKVCKDGLRAEIVFPSCWNGKDADSDNHKTHMAYPNLVEAGDICPPGFPKRLPTLLYETIWDVSIAEQRGFNGQLVLSVGDPIGTGYHGDFMNGWEQDVLRRAVDTCTNLSGNIEDCPVFKPTLQSEEQMKACKKVISQEIDEDVMGPMSELPGCNKIVATGYPPKGGCPGEKGWKDETHVGNNLHDVSAPGDVPAQVVDEESAGIPEDKPAAPAPKAAKYEPAPKYEPASKHQPAPKHEPASKHQPAPKYEPASKHQPAPKHEPAAATPYKVHSPVVVEEEEVVTQTTVVYVTASQSDCVAPSPAAPSAGYHRRHLHGHRKN